MYITVLCTFRVQFSCISVNFSQFFISYLQHFLYLFQDLLFNAKFLFTVLLDCSANPSYLQKQHVHLLFIPTECCSDLLFFKGFFEGGGRGGERRCFLFGVFSPFFLVFRVFFLCLVFWCFLLLLFGSLRFF